MCKILNICYLTLIPFITLYSQDTLVRFKPVATPLIKIYSNFYTGLTSTDNSTAFEITRVYLGYGIKLNEDFSGEVKLDIGSPDDVSQFSLLRRYAYFKTAGLTYNKNGLQIHFGLIDLYQFKLQEKFWGRRYIYQSFQDEYGFGSSADIGMNITYQLNQFLKIDGTIMNGEGYKKLQSDRTYKEALGITFTPKEYFVLRVYSDLTRNKVYQYTLSSFAGFNQPKYKIGIEYNQKFNAEFIKEGHLYGISTYGSYNILKRWWVFARYDRLTSNKNNRNGVPWHLAEDGTALIGGIEFSPISNVNLAIDYKDWYPWAQNGPNRSYLFFNVEFSL